jgi:hypothetical protein
MSIKPKITNEKIPFLEIYGVMPSKKSSANIEISITKDPIASTPISKISTNNLTVSSMIKAGLVFLATIGGCYLAKTTNIFSYFRKKTKNLNSKDINNGEKKKIKNRVNNLNVRRNSEILEKTNGLLVNQVIQLHNSKDRAVEFEEIKVKEFEDLSEVKEENITKLKSINVKNPIPNQNIAVGKQFNFLIDGTSVFNSNSSLFLEALNIPTWLISRCKPTLKGSYHADIRGINISSNYAYLTGTPSLQIVDISDPANPIFKGSYNTSSSANGVAVSGNYAYVIDNSGLQIVNITDPTNPTFKGSYDTPDVALEVVLSVNYAYVTDSNSGLQIIDISDPANPTFKGSYYEMFTEAITISSNYAYLAGTSLQIIDISDPANPTFKGSYDTPNDLAGVALSRNYVYVADHSSGLQIIDISDPSNPTFKGSYDTPDQALGVAISGNYAYVAGDISGLQIVNITDPANPTFKASYYMPYLLFSEVAVSGNYAYIADCDSGLLYIIEPNLDKLILSGIPNSIGTYKVNIKACNEEKECVTDSFYIIVSTDLTTTLIIIGSIAGGTICIASFCCSLGGGGIIVLKRYRNRNKVLKSAIPINDPQVIGKNDYSTISDAKDPKFLSIT